MNDSMSKVKTATQPKVSESQKTRTPKPKRKVTVDFVIGANFKKFCNRVYQKAKVKLTTDSHYDAFTESVSEEDFANYYYTLLDSRFKYVARESGANVRPIVKPGSRILNDPTFNMFLNQVSEATNDITNVTIDFVESSLSVEEGYEFKLLSFTEMERISDVLESYNVATSWAYGYDNSTTTQGAEALPMFVMFMERADTHNNTYYVWSTNRSEPDLCYMAHTFGLNIAESAYVVPNIPLIGKEEVWAQILLIT